MRIGPAGHSATHPWQRFLGTKTMSDISRRGFLGAAALTAAASASENEAAAAEAEGEKKKLPSYRYALEASKPRVEEGGTAREVTTVQLPASRGLAGVSMRLKPGGLRELHWHATAAEWAYVIKGRCRVTIFDPNGQWETLDFG